MIRMEAKSHWDDYKTMKEVEAQMTTEKQEWSKAMEKLRMKLFSPKKALKKKKRKSRA